jgi:hypothetical protein
VIVVDASALLEFLLQTPIGTMVDDARRPDEEVQNENPVVTYRISLQG